MPSFSFPSTYAAPKWFKHAIAAPVESKHVHVDGCRIHYLQWRPKRLPTMRDEPPSLVLLHGSAAHAHWWQHIAPFFCEDGYEVVALSFSGFGDSETRNKLGLGVWETEVIEVCRHAGLLARAVKPIIVGHSLGSFVAVETCRLHHQILAGLVVLDGGFPHPINWELTHPDVLSGKRESMFGSREKLPNNKDSRLRMTPDQEVLPYVKEHIANHSWKLAAHHAGDVASSAGADATAAGTATAAAGEERLFWTWKFDPLFNVKMDFLEYVQRVGRPEVLLKLPLKVAAVYGAESKVVDRENTQPYMRARMGANITMVAIPGAGHHCFLDQPIAVVSTLRALFAEWNRSATAWGGAGTGTDTTMSGQLLPRLSHRSSHSSFDGDEDALRTRAIAQISTIFAPPPGAKARAKAKKPDLASKPRL